MSTIPVTLKNEQRMEVIVNGPGAANRLFIYTGTAVFDPPYKGTGSSWKTDTASFDVGKFTVGQFINGIAWASLGKISNDGTASNAGWGVENADADWDEESSKVKVTVDVSVRDSDGFIETFGFQVTVLANMNAK
jgi:hypothetical protein